METHTSEIKKWCDRKFDDVVNVLGTCNVNIHVYSYYRGGEWVVCDFWHGDDENKLADTTFAFGDDTNFDDLYSPHIENVIILFELLTELTKRFNGNIHFGMPDSKMPVHIKDDLFYADIHQ